MWSSSEGTWYREQARLVGLGWATVETEAVGGRSRKRYTITDGGRGGICASGSSTTPQEPHFEIEGLLRLFVGDHGAATIWSRSMRATAATACAMLDELSASSMTTSADGGPLWMLEQGVGGPGGERVEFGGRPMFPERLHVVAVVLDVTTRLLTDVEGFADGADARSAPGPALSTRRNTAATRARLEAISARLALRPVTG